MPQDALAKNNARARARSIVDNRDRRVGDVLRDEIAPASALSFVSAYFTIYAYEALRDVLEAAGRLRFLYGDPQGLGTVDPAASEAKAFGLTDDGGIALKQALAQKPLAKACAAWIERQVDIRTVDQANFLHGKLYHVAHLDGTSAALLGSSNFTRRGLGLGSVPNIELNTLIGSADERDALREWFDALWTNGDLTRDAKQEVLAALARLGKAYSPEFVYYKTLFHIFEERLAERGERDGLVQDVALDKTAVWKALYEFQRNGATNAINRLLRHNGCIVADSVGLGKTWTALAVIKFFELRNERVLVLCPKRLEQNWVRYTSRAAYRNNPFDKDRLGYTVLAHTDLSRYEGKAGDIDLAQFNWGAFDLIVIDESHNFRNEGRDRTDEDGTVIRRSRYNRLLTEVLKGGVHSKVLMLSATPVNTSLRDLRNQIYLMTEKRQDAFKDALGIGSIQTMFGTAEKQFLQWESKRRSGAGSTDASKETLLAGLGADFLALLDAVTIARSREHIRRYYPKVVEDIGGFPTRARPVNLHPPTDRQGKLSYDDLHERIGELRLAVYTPSAYLLDKSELEAERQKLGFDQRTREHHLTAMLRVNLLKRLESSAHAFGLTALRILDKIRDVEERIDAWRKQREREAAPLARRQASGVDTEIDVDPEEDEDDEEFTVGKRRRYRFEEMNLNAWAEDLAQDRGVFERLHALAAQVNVERDGKLAELKRVIAEKVRTASKDKDGRPNRKVLVFTTFADTARYLYENVEKWARELGVHAALATGGSGNKATLGGASMEEVLGRFSPRAQQWPEDTDEVDILIATDCLSEGQNLQDCDRVVHYDVHWNPVRLMQRFGRIDRLGSRNTTVGMVNFWPTKNLDRYLDLKNRVEARMALVDATATGLDDPLESDRKASEAKNAVQLELQFRDQQLLRLREETLDVEDATDGVSMNDLTLDDFIADLLNYIQRHRQALEAAPFGIYAVADVKQASGESVLSDAIRPGVIFCLKQKATVTQKTPNRLQPYYLAYIRNDGTVRFTFRQAKQVLALFQAVAGGADQAVSALEDAFDAETRQGKDMAKYEGLLEKTLRSIAGTFGDAQQQALGQDRDAKLAPAAEQPKHGADFELVTWIVLAMPA